MLAKGRARAIRTARERLESPLLLEDIGGVTTEIEKAIVRVVFNITKYDSTSFDFFKLIDRDQGCITSSNMIVSGSVSYYYCGSLDG